MVGMKLQCAVRETALADDSLERGLDLFLPDARRGLAPTSGSRSDRDE
jgi:hypothetical protein